MLFLRLFTVWVVSWFAVGFITCIYGVIMWGGDSVGTAGSIFLTTAFLVQPLICGVLWLIATLDASDLQFLLRSIRDWVKGQ